MKVDCPPCDAIGNTPLIRLRRASCDSALRFQLKLFNHGFLHSNGPPVMAWRERSPGHCPTGALAG